MAVPYRYHLQARREAPFHLQVQVMHPLAVGHTPAKVSVKGRVVRVFRSDGTLKVGDEVTFSMWVYRQDDHKPTGSTFILYETLMRVNYIEVYLAGDPTRYVVPFDEYIALDRPTRLPWLTASRLSELLVTLLLLLWKPLQK